MGLSLSHILLILVVVLVVFGAGKLPKIMGDLARGVRSFREGMKEEEGESAPKLASKLTHSEEESISPKTSSQPKSRKK